PCKAPALPRPPPCLAKNILAKYKSTFYQELVLNSIQEQKPTFFIIMPVRAKSTAPLREGSLIL
ncbi:MAG: hypothetical protein UFA98_07220, partial [Ruminococcus sp.]|nr:hypothetical protein [Ruminococcus sp.]